MSRHGHKYSKYKKYLIMIMLICTKERLCNIFEAQVMKKLRNTEAELRKALLMKKRRAREKCPNAKFFLVRIFTYSDQKKLRIWTFFTQ